MVHITFAEVAFECGVLLIILALIELHIKGIREDIEEGFKNGEINTTIRHLITTFVWGFLLIVLGIFFK